MIYLIKIWDRQHDKGKIFEGYSKTEPLNKEFNAWTNKTDEKGTTLKVNFQSARYRITYETA